MARQPASADTTSRAKDKEEHGLRQPTAAPVQEITAGCPMAALLQTLTRPWTMHILWLLTANGPMRFGALKRSAEGISARLLTLRLRTLEAEGFVQRTVVAGRVPEVVYSPTPQSAEMHELMAQLATLSERWKSAKAAP